ncbi:MAG: Nif3-like dinuclear metal center hexameric protein [Taibaiella sp.]|nr:Nif3-like dinuclear metal center hexameric protein [Taibaiella sp.]
MQVKQITEIIETIAPLAYQESYDNCGMQVGDQHMEVTGILLTLDVTEDVVDEAINSGCNLIIAHHPLIFTGLKKITGRNYVERIVFKAIKNDVAIYAAHTNLDNMREGVNATFAAKLGLTKTRILSQRNDTLSKLFTYAPAPAADKVRDALFLAGAGRIGNYKECSFNITGQGTFRAEKTAQPVIGEAGGNRELVKEVKIEVILEKHNQASVIAALFAAHPYEEVAYELIPLPNYNQDIGAGMIGQLPEAMTGQEFLHFLKDKMKTDCIRHTAYTGKPIQNVAVCGGSGSFLLKDALRAGADVFVTADFKYHQFFDAEGKILIADIGHYETEQFTPEIFAAVLNKKLPNFAVRLSNVLTNPVKYFS